MPIEEVFKDEHCGIYSYSNMPIEPCKSEYKYAACPTCGLRIKTSHINYVNYTN